MGFSINCAQNRKLLSWGGGGVGGVGNRRELGRRKGEMQAQRRDRQVDECMEGGRRGRWRGRGRGSGEKRGMFKVGIGPGK